MKAKPMSGYFMVQIDGCSPYKVSFNAPKDSVVTLATALRNEVHGVRIMYAIEGYGRMPEFRGFGLDDGCKLLSPLPLPERRIEFIGDSMTCGYGIEASNEKEKFADETENHYYTYAALTARALKAQHVVVARSGIGIYRNYNGPKTGNADCMPRLYDRTLFCVEEEKWDFSRYTPDVVCVNLGTNDVSTEPYDKTMFNVILLLVNLALIVTVFAIALFSNYSVDKKGIVLRLGFFKVVYKKEELHSIKLFSKTQKLVLYLVDAKFTVIVINANLYQAFTKAVQNEFRQRLHLRPPFMESCWTRLLILAWQIYISS